MLRETNGPHMYRQGCFITRRGPIPSPDMLSVSLSSLPLSPFLSPPATRSHWFLETEGAPTLPDRRDLPGT